MTLVVDASVVASALIRRDSRGQWAEAILEQGDVVAPQFMPVEVANTLRNLVLTRSITEREGARAHLRLLGLPIALLPYDAVALQVWNLRNNVAPYDAWYVALAENLECELATLDGNLTRAPGPRCRFLTPPDV
jgi:predicted nucleic acid-binding protein